MPVFQFQCQDCFAIFDHMFGIKIYDNINCVNCGTENINRLNETVFYPNKNFCPHDKELNLDNLTKQMSGIMVDKSQKCGGCGSDGAPGKCSSGGCGGGCSCKSAADSEKKSCSGGCKTGGCGCSSNLQKRILTAPSKLVVEI